MSSRSPFDSSSGWQNQTQVIAPGGQKGRPAGGGNDCIVVIYSQDSANLGKRFVLEQSNGVTVGRGAESTIVLESESVSRRHARFERRDGAWWVVDMRSTNGTYVNDEFVGEHKLRKGDHVKIGDTIFKYLTGSDVEAAYHEEIYRMTIVDGLTQAHNKRFLFEQMDKEISRARRYGRPLTLVMFDLDHFKKVNDTYGHLAGDYVLRELASLVRGRIRRDEVFARYGGEEFAIMMPETDMKSSLAVAESLNRMVAQHNFVFEGTRIPVSISVGLAQLGEHRTIEEFVDAADRKLYEAKRTGRNKVVS